MKRFIDIHIPISKCNLNCHYCYVNQENSRDRQVSPFKYSAEYIGKALSNERLGGICHFNLCGVGETLIPEETVDITREILKQGHYVMIVTNALLTKRLEQFSLFPEEYRKRLGFKCSFHYLELKKRGLLNKFFDNIDFIRKNGMSISIEMTPSDELEPYIDEVKKICTEREGALCHVTIPRDMTKEGIVLLSEHSFEEFCNIWEQFNSEMFEFKRNLWENKRNEFCYAGEWSGLLNVGDGIMTQCYGMCLKQNIFKDIKNPIKWSPIGKNCCLPHCYNSHSLLGLGVIPEISGNYALERDRVDNRDGSHWLTDEMREFLSHRLEDYNEVHSDEEQIRLDKSWKSKIKVQKKMDRMKTKVRTILK